MKIPLLIGGATTSRQHTAVKIAPAYAEPVAHVLDASRAVGTVAALLTPEQREAFVRKIGTEQEELRKRHARGPVRPLVAYADANARAPRIEFSRAEIAPPPFLGRREVEVQISDLLPYIDWTFFFTAWELSGRYPEILDHPKYGQAARELFAHAKPILERIAREGLLRARGVYGYFAATSDANDIVLYGDESRTRELARFSMLRQQREKPDGEPELCLADYVAPTQSGVPDHVGAFAVTAGIGASELAGRFERDGDDYSAIVVKALADRLAEAFAELLHERVRREWYAPDERLDDQDLLAERYRGTRPAFGYPACPVHSDKGALFSILDAPAIGMGLTESFAMTPAASVSGLYLAHPAARYFSVGKIDRAQVEDYARRRGITVALAERELAPVLGYEPAR